MILRRVLRPSNRRVRILVGLLLAGLFCIQCSRTEAFKETTWTMSIDGKTIGTVAPDTLDQLEKLAKTDHIAFLNRCVKHYDAHYRDYTCTLVKQERLRGKLSKEQWIRVKFRDKPFSVAMAWVRNAGRGDRVLYVEGKYGGKMLVRPTSGLLQKLLGTVKKDPQGKDARKSSLRTVNKFGFKRGMHSLLEYYVKGKKNGVLKEAFGDYAEVAGRKTIVLVRFLPDTKDYPSHRTKIFIDLQHLVPVCVEGYNEAGDLICRYVYKDVKFNVGLTEKDFLPEANGMASPK